MWFVVSVVTHVYIQDRAVNNKLGVVYRYTTIYMFMSTRISLENSEKQVLAL